VKAVLFDTDSRVELVDMPAPSIGERDVLIQVGACGICASDLHLAEIKAGILDLPYPFVPGHEVAGTVVKVGTSVTSVQVGEHVVVQPLVHCGTCTLCQKGRVNLCQNAQIIGLHCPGGFAEYLAVPARNAYPCGELPDETAACTEPLACALHGLARLEPRAADDVLVFGAGTIGLLFLQLVRNHNVGRITAVDLHPHRLERAIRLGADHVVTAEDARGGALKELSPAGFDCVVDATGVPAVVEDTFRRVAPGGKLLLLGSSPTVASITIQPRMLQYRDATVMGAFGFSFEFFPALQLLREGRVDIGPIVTHHYRLDAYEVAFEQARQGNEGVKIHLTP
jgi:2-desacetyl-2-hydroxyethyl bacteriochlorophyllide A dehydrogenase